MDALVVVVVAFYQPKPRKQLPYQPTYLLSTANNEGTG